MIVVTKKKGETTDKILRKFSKMFREEDIIFDVNKKVFFKKPSLLKKEKLREKMKAKHR
jgi:ribosomal protein S21